MDKRSRKIRKREEKRNHNIKIRLNVFIRHILQLVTTPFDYRRPQYVQQNDYCGYVGKLLRIGKSIGEVKYASKRIRDLCRIAVLLLLYLKQMRVFKNYLNKWSYHRFKCRLNF